MVKSAPPPLFGDHPILQEAETEWVVTSDNKHLRLAKWKHGERGTVHIFNGRTEYIEKYVEVIARLVSRGFAVSVHDWRGQGMSTRNQRYPKRSHIMEFSEYQRDAATIMRACEDMPGPRKLFSHSMGGAIALRYLHFSHDITSAVFSAPMWGVHVPVNLRPFAPLLLRYIERHERQWDCVISTSEKPYESYEPFWRNLLTTDRDEYAKLSAMTKTFPELGLGGPTYYWYFAARQEIEELLAKDAPNIPALVFVGSKEKVVDRKRLSAYTKSAENFRLIEFKGGKHENYLERPEIREQFWEQIDSFWLTS